MGRPILSPVRHSIFQSPHFRSCIASAPNRRSLISSPTPRLRIHPLRRDILGWKSAPVLASCFPREQIEHVCISVWGYPSYQFGGFGTEHLLVKDSNLAVPRTRISGEAFASGTLKSQRQQQASSRRSQSFRFSPTFQDGMRTNDFQSLEIVANNILSPIFDTYPSLLSLRVTAFIVRRTEILLRQL